MSPSAAAAVVATYPSANDTWTVTLDRNGAGTYNADVWAICVNAPA